MKRDFYKDRDNRTWNKIKYRREIYEADPNFPRLFYQQGLHKMLRLGVDNPPKDRYKLAAGLLAIVKNGGPYYHAFKDIV